LPNQVIIIIIIIITIEPRRSRELSVKKERPTNVAELLNC
jgi:hypothetical protein